MRDEQHPIEYSVRFRVGQGIAFTLHAERPVGNHALKNFAHGSKGECVPFLQLFEPGKRAGCVDAAEYVSLDLYSLDLPQFERSGCDRFLQRRTGHPQSSAPHPDYQPLRLEQSYRPSHGSGTYSNPSSQVGSRGETFSFVPFSGLQSDANMVQRLAQCRTFRWVNHFMPLAYLAYVNINNISNYT